MKIRRILAVTLAACLLAVNVPVTAFADAAGNEERTEDGTAAAYLSETENAAGTASPSEAEKQEEEPAEDGAPEGAASEEKPAGKEAEIDAMKGTDGVCKIGEKEYSTVKEALNEAVSGETVLMTADSAEAALTVKSGVTLDTNGKELTTTGGWTLAEGSVTLTDSILNGEDVTALSGVGTVSGAVYAPEDQEGSYTLDLRGVDLRLKGSPLLYGGTPFEPETLDTLKATRVLFGNVSGGGNEQTIKNIILENCSTAYRLALGVYYDSLTVDTVSVNAEENWYWNQQYQDYNYQMITCLGGELNINKSLTTGEYANAYSSVGYTGITNLAVGAELNCVDFQNTGTVTEDTLAEKNVHVNGAGATLNAAALNNHAITSFGTVNLTEHPVLTTADTGLFSVNYGSGAVLTIGSLTFISDDSEESRHQLRTGDDAETIIGALKSSDDGADFYVTGASKTTVNQEGGNEVSYTGDIVFTEYSNSDTADTKFRLKLDSSDDSFTGSVRGTSSASARWGKWASAVNADAVEKADAVTGMELALSNGSGWTMTGDSVVNTLTVAGASVNGDYALTVKDTASLDASGRIAVKDFTNAGTLSIDMTGADDQSIKLIDCSGTGSYGTCQFAAGKDNGYALKVKENDLYAVKAAASITDPKGTVNYITVQEAINSCAGSEAAPAAEETEIRMLADSTENVIIGKGKNIILDLNGHVLQGTGDGSVIRNYGTLTVRDSNSEQKTHRFAVDSATGLWTLDETDGTRIISGGCITGGGREVPGSGGGGVFINENCKFVMTGGAIAGNIARQGGGIYTGSNSTVVLEDAAIAGNYAEELFGGVLFNANTTAGKTPGLKLGGSVRIAENTVKSDSRTVSSNLTLWDAAEAPVTIDPGQPLTSEAAVYLALRTPGGASVGAFTTNGRQDDAGYFHSDTDACAVVFRTDHLELVNAYTVTYNENGATGGEVPAEPEKYASGAEVTVKGNTGALVKTGYAFTGWNTEADGSGTAYAPDSTFSITENTVLYAQWLAKTAPQGSDLTFIAEFCIYNGAGRPVTFTGKAGMGEISAEYAAEGSTEWTKTAPVNAGKYRVKAVIAESADYAPAELTDESWKFEIYPAALTVTGSAADGKKYDGTTRAVVHVGTLSGKITGDEVEIASAEGTFDTKDVGNGKDVCITYTLSGADAGNYTVSNSFTFADIERAAGKAAAPTAKELTYNGLEQVLAEAGSSDTGTVKYSLSETGAYTETIPTGNAAGSYEVWYYAAGDSNHEDTAKAKITVKIARKAIAVPAAETGLVYDGSVKTGVKDGTGYTLTGNTAVNAGEYTAAAKLDSNYQWSGKAAAEAVSDAAISWEISRACYDMSGVSFKDKTVSYDGSAKSLAVTGELPEGVTVSYEGNGQKYSGRYTVTAKFSGDAENYEEIPDLTARLTIIAESSAEESSSAAVSPGWILDTKGWRYRFADGTYAAGGWYEIANPYAGEGQEKTSWFHFGTDTYMQTGWFTDQDGKKYYLHPVSDGTMGRMYHGKHTIDGKTYEFSEVHDGSYGHLTETGTKKTPEE